MLCFYYVQFIPKFLVRQIGLMYTDGKHRSSKNLDQARYQMPYIIMILVSDRKSISIHPYCR